MGTQTNFSNKSRKERVEQARQTVYDLIVIGGGVTGAGILLDATTRGLKAVLVEKLDFASGTSSKSTKLIHGGLRYLKQLEFGLVRETGLERSIAHQNAPHLVHPENMFLPIVKNGTFSKFTASMAISVYDWLAKVPKEDRKKSLSKTSTLQKEPLLRSDILKSSIVYSEYRTDDARLTLELIKTARCEIIDAFNYMEVTDFTYDDKIVNGVICHDHITGEEVSLKAECIVNASGPWVDTLRITDDQKTETNLRLSKGVHLVFDYDTLPLKNSTYFDAFDGRMLFAIPRGKAIYVGTTDTNYDKDKDDLQCTHEDVTYILDAINQFFKIAPLTVDDVQSSWVGLRPLIHQKGKPPTELSRKDEIFVSDSGLISIAGGKLTGYRKMAERIVDLVYKTNVHAFQNSKSETLKLSHESFNDYKDYKSFIQKMNQEYTSYGLSVQQVTYLISTYGKSVIKILEGANFKESDDVKVIQQKLLHSQLSYGLEYESVYHPMDFLDRRTGWLFFDIRKAKDTVDFVISEIGKYLELSQANIDRMKSDCLHEISIHGLDKFKKQSAEV